jgi:hypothetical protein
MDRPADRAGPLEDSGPPQDDGPERSHRVKPAAGIEEISTMEAQQAGRPAPTVIDEGIAALARHYGVPEAEIIEDLYGGCRSRVSLEDVAESLVTVLGVLNDFGFDDAAVTAAEETDLS